MAQLTLSDYKNNLFTPHYLEERISELPEWNEVEVEDKFEQVKELFQENKEILRKDDGESDTQKEFIDKILEEILGHYFVTEKSKRFGGELLTPDYLFLKDKTEQKEILNSDEKDYFSESYVVADAKDWDRPLDAGDKTDHSNPKYQIFNYVDRTRIKWGILTNGRKWRLYCYEDLDTKTFYEIDLINLITKPKDEKTLESFKLFYLLFRKEAFLPKESGFADKVLEGSEKFSKNLEDNLEDKIYSALEVAGRGFLNTPENNLEKTPENIELAQRSSLILLYRFLFILNAESRDLLPVGDKAYDQSLSLQWYKEKILNEPDHAHLQQNTIGWNSRIRNLFSAVNSGQDLHTTKIPPYNGGLFDPENGEENRFLEKNALRGNYIKEIIKLLAMRKEDDELKTVDYKSFNIRHLGSIYEGLLEHKLQKAEENLILKSGEWIKASESDKKFSEVDEKDKVLEGEVYLTNESGERKATGSYYTPDYIVEYIVENTIGPKVEEKIENHPTLEQIENLESEEQEKAENEKIESILELNVCDPAMGSGHFLTEATEYIAKQIYHGVPLKHQDIEEDEEGLNWAKRQVVQNCIYGVDINPLAVELGKLSLWIETMSEGKPLNFLDHHLKHGNSLIGSSFEDMVMHPSVEERPEDDLEEFEVMVNDKKEALKVRYTQIEKGDEEDVDDIYEKENQYEKLKESQDYINAKQVLNVHTHQSFEKTLSPGEYGNVRDSILDLSELRNEEWFQEAQVDAEKRDYFHWQLEFPKVFFGETQGFDAVVGNPPYVSVSEIPSDQKDYILSNVYSTTQRRVDLYVAFIEKGFSLNAQEGQLSYIIPQPFLSQTYAEELRKYLLDYDIPEIVDLSEYEIFEDAEVDNIILSLRASNDRDEVLAIEQDEDPNMTETIAGIEKKISKADFRKMFNTMYRLEINPSLLELKESIDNNSFRLGEGMAAKWGARGSPISDFHFEEKINENCEKMIKGSDVHRFYSNYRDRWLLYDYDELYRPAFPELFENPKLMVSKVTGDEGLRVAVDSNNYYTDDSVCNCVKKTALKDKSEAFLNRRKISINEEGLDLISDYDLRYISGILSSRLLNFYFRNLVGYDLNVYPDSVQYLPIYQDPQDDSASKIISRYENGEEKQEEFFDEVNSFFDWLESSWDLEIEDMSLKNSIKEYWKHDFDEFMRVAKKNKSQIDGSVKSREFRELMKEEWENSMNTLRPLMQEIDELENEIDAIVFDLYDLTEEEVETVLDSLDTGEDEKYEILENFGNFKS